MSIRNIPPEIIRMIYGYCRSSEFYELFQEDIPEKDIVHSLNVKSFEEFQTLCKVYANLDKGIIKISPILTVIHYRNSIIDSDCRKFRKKMQNQIHLQA
jgi:hypothetical protein